MAVQEPPTPIVPPVEQLPPACTENGPKVTGAPSVVDPMLLLVSVTVSVCGEPTEAVGNPAAVKKISESSTPVPFSVTVLVSVPLVTVSSTELVTPVTGLKITRTQQPPPAGMDGQGEL